MTTGGWRPKAPLTLTRPVDARAFRNHPIRAMIRLAFGLVLPVLGVDEMALGARITDGLEEDGS